LIKETEAILDAEKKKLEWKQHRTQKEIEALVDLNITYKLTGGGQNAWKDVPILSADDKQRYTKPVNNSDEILELKKQIQLLKQDKNTIESQANQIESLKQEEKTKEQERKNIINEMERLKSSYSTLEQLLKSKEDTIVFLNRENKMLSTVNQGNQQGATGTVDTLKKLLQAKTNETELIKQNMELLLANEKRRNDILEQEIRALTQERPQQQATVQNTGPLNSNINSTNSNPTQHEQHDDSYNDLNYESEYSDTEESDGDDINYDTPSEDEDSNNDLNYGDTNESNK
jgi:hypothetical protein